MHYAVGVGQTARAVLVHNRPVMLQNQFVLPQHKTVLVQNGFVSIQYKTVLSSKNDEMLTAIDLHCHSPPLLLCSVLAFIV
jgi:hypothetical protein